MRPNEPGRSFHARVCRSHSPRIALDPPAPHAVLARSPYRRGRAASRANGPGNVKILVNCCNYSYNERVDGLPGLAANLNRLMASTPRAAGSSKPWSDLGLAQAMTARGCPTTHVWVLKTRSGALRNPSAVRIAVLADVFDVPVSYFFDPAIASMVNSDLDARALGSVADEE